jgi:hypothetical protein
MFCNYSNVAEEQKLRLNILMARIIKHPSYLRFPIFQNPGNSSLMQRQNETERETRNRVFPPFFQIALFAFSAKV